jgi:DUF971 family protein
MSESALPSNIRIRRQSRLLRLEYPDSTCHEIPFELLRVYSPSAEVRGHGSGAGILQTGKRSVTIEKADMVGNYAIRLTFSDGHDSGIFSWDYLNEIGERQPRFWQDYLARLEQEGGSRD